MSLLLLRLIFCLAPINQSIHPLRAASMCLTIRLPIIRQGKGGLALFDDYCIHMCDQSWWLPTCLAITKGIPGCLAMPCPERSRLATVSSSQHERLGYVSPRIIDFQCP